MNSEIKNNILSKYPKKKTNLPEKYIEIYQKSYKENRDGEGFANSISQNLESWGHKIIESRTSKINFKNTLEIGAGNLNHLNYIKESQIYDIIEPNKWFFENSINLKKVNKVYSNISQISHENFYDRIVSVMVLEHLTDLPNVIEKSKKLLKSNGIFQAAVPCEGELAFYCGWRFGTGLSFLLKYGLDWGVIMRHEHVNNFKEVTEVIKFYFKDITIKRSLFPFFLKTKHASFYAYIEAKN